MEYILTGIWNHRRSEQQWYWHESLATAFDLNGFFFSFCVWLVFKEDFDLHLWIDIFFEIQYEWRNNFLVRWKNSVYIELFPRQQPNLEQLSKTNMTISPNPTMEKFAFATNNFLWLSTDACHVLQIFHFFRLNFSSWAICFLAAMDRTSNSQFVFVFTC